MSTNSQRNEFNPGGNVVKEIDIQPKRFKEKYRVKSHLNAGAHGIILWAVDREQSFTKDDGIDVKQKNIKQMPKSNVNPDDVTDWQEANRIQQQYAIKRIFIRGRTVPLSIVREIKVLQFLRGHPNVIELLDVKPSGCSINLVFPLMPLNLTTIIYEHRISYRQCAIYFRMLAQGVHYLHQNGIVHRDLKPSNLLIDWTGVLKLCDFGQARSIDISVEMNGQQCELSYQVCTRWYRAPELLYGSTSYSYDVDMWSIGTILAEMIQEWPLFKGENDIEQLSLVVKTLGQPPPPEKWNAKLPDFDKIHFFDQPNDTLNGENSQLSEESDANKVEYEEDSEPKWLQSIREKCHETKSNKCSNTVLNLIGKLCRYTKRITAKEVLEHEFVNFDRNDAIGDAGTSLARLYIQAKQVKHLSGPPRNEL